MHELGVVIEVVKTVEKFAAENNVTKIQALVLQIGQISTMIPKYIEACYPAAAEGTILENATLRIEVLPANGICLACNKVYNVWENRDGCPKCGKKQFDLLTGKEFLIKEITAY